MSNDSLLHGKCDFRSCFYHLPTTLLNHTNWPCLYQRHSILQWISGMLNMYWQNHTEFVGQTFSVFVVWATLSRTCNKDTCNFAGARLIQDKYRLRIFEPVRNILFETISELYACGYWNLFTLNIAIYYPTPIDIHWYEFDAMFLLFCSCVINWTQNLTSHSPNTLANRSLLIVCTHTHTRV